MVIKRENDYKIKFKIADRVCRKQIQELTSLRSIVKEIEEVIMPNGDNSNPCMKCGSIQCARCGVDILNEFNKIKKKFTHKEA